MTQRTNSPTIPPGATHRFASVPFDHFRVLVEVTRAHATNVVLPWTGGGSWDQTNGFAGQDLGALTDGDTTTHLKSDGPVTYPIVRLDGDPGLVTKAIVSWTQAFQPEQYVIETTEHWHFGTWRTVAAPPKNDSGIHEFEFINPIDNSGWWRVRVVAGGHAQLIELRLLGNRDVVNTQRTVCTDLEVYEEAGHVAVRNTRQDPIEVQVLSQ